MEAFASVGRSSGYTEETLNLSMTAKRVSIPTSRFLQSQEAEQRVPHFTSKFEILLMRLKAAWMDFLPIHTAQSPEFLASVQDANNRRLAQHQQAAGAGAPPPDLLNPESAEVYRQYTSGRQTRHMETFPLNDNLIAQFFIIQSELSDQQRERLISAMSLRNITLENYTYDMMKTQYHDLFITTSIQDPSI